MQSPSPRSGSTVLTANDRRRLALGLAAGQQWPIALAGLSSTVTGGRGSVKGSARGLQVGNAGKEQPQARSCPGPGPGQALIGRPPGV